MTKAVLLGVSSCENIPDPNVISGVTRLTCEVCVATITENPVSIAVYILINPTDSSAVIRQKMIDQTKADVLNQLGKTLENQDIILPTYTTGLATLASETRSDSFTVAGNGSVVDVSLRPKTTLSLVVEGVGGTPTAWNVT